MLSIFVPDACPYSHKFEHKAKTREALDSLFMCTLGSLCQFMLMKYIGLYIYICKVSSRIGAGLKDGQGIPLSLLTQPFLPLLSPFILSPFSVPFSSYSLIPPFQFSLFPILIAWPFFISLYSLPLSRPFSLLFSLYSLLPSFSSPALFFILPISFSILFACSHLISSHSLLFLHRDHFPTLFSLFPPPSFLFPSLPSFFSQSSPYS